MAFSNEIVEIIDIFFLLSSHLFLCILLIPFHSLKPPFWLHVTCVLLLIPFSQHLFFSSWDLLSSFITHTHTHTHALMTPPTVKEDVHMREDTRFLSFLVWVTSFSTYVLFFYLPTHSLDCILVICTALFPQLGPKSPDGRDCACLVLPDIFNNCVDWLCEL